MKKVKWCLWLGLIGLSSLQGADEREILEGNGYFSFGDPREDTFKEETPADIAWGLYDEKKYREALNYSINFRKTGKFDCSEVLAFSLLKLYNVHDTEEYCYVIKYLEEGITYLGTSEATLTHRKELSTIVRKMKRLGYGWPMRIDPSKIDEDIGCLCCF